MFAVPDCETISASFSESSAAIIEDTKGFLLDTTESKNPSSRLLAWLRAFDLLPESPNSWFTNLHDKCVEYRDKIESTFGDHPDNPLEGLPANYMRSLTNDMKRIVSWLVKIAGDVGLSGDVLENATMRLSRIYSLIVRDENGIKYVQGLDRFGCVCLLCCTMHTHATSLPLDFAEAMAFYLTRAMLLRIPFMKLFKSQPAIVEHFARIDKVVKVWAPRQYRAMVAGNSGSKFFGSRWEMMWFADEHKGQELILLWDQIFGRMESIGRFVPSLTVSHVMQIDIPMDADSVNCVVLNWDQWDIGRLTSDAISILEGGDVAESGCCGSRKCAEIQSDEDIIARM